MASTRGRQVVVPLTNKSGGSVAAGDVVIIDTTNNEAFTTTTSAGVTGGVGIAQGTIANNDVGRVLLEGYAALVNVNASVTRGNFGKTHTVAKQATDAGASRGVGTFCQFLTGGTTPTARIYPPDVNAASGNVATDAIWDAKGDLAGGTGADAASRLAVGAAGTILVPDSSQTTGLKWDPRFHGAKAYNSTTQSLAASTGDIVLTFDSEEYDTDAIHDTGSNTGRITIPTGMGGKWRISAGGLHVNGTASSLFYFQKNGATQLRAGLNIGPTNSVNLRVNLSIVVDLAAADYVQLLCTTGAGASQTFGHASNANAQGWLAAEFLG
jgi:hypothetical protein